MLNNPNGMSGWAAGDMWKLFDLTGPGAISSNFAIDDTSLALGGALVGNFNIVTGNYYITAVPEPSRMMLLGIALLGLGFRRRRG